MESDIRTRQQEPRLTRTTDAAKPVRGVNSRSAPANAMDHDQQSGRAMHAPFEAPRARPRDRRQTWHLPRLSRFKGLHVTIRANLDQGDGASAICNEIAFF